MERIQVFGTFILDFVPEFFCLKERAGKLWSEYIANVEPSFLPEIGDEIIFFTLRVKKGGHAHSHEIIEVLKKSGYHLPNVFGLLLVRDLIKTKKEIQLPPFPVWFLGYDELSHLGFVHRHGHMVPHLLALSSIEFEYGHLPYKSKLEADEIIVAFKKK